MSLDIPPGMFGLLGPNGAGKTTLMKILATLLEPDSGTAKMGALDLIADKPETRKILGQQLWACFICTALATTIGCTTP